MPKPAEQQDMWVNMCAGMCAGMCTDMCSGSGDESQCAADDDRSGLHASGFISALSASAPHRLYIGTISRAPMAMV